MAFNWQAFLDANHIPYVTSGPNVSRGHIAVKCPFCGSADPSEHMSLNTEHSGWRCFRSNDHRGKSPVYLVQALLGTTLDRARQIVGDSVFIPDNFLESVMAKMSPAVSVKRKALKLPEEFRRIENKPSAKRFIEYLRQRGFSTAQIGRMTKDYGLRYCREGAFAGRLIFPVWFEGALMTWTGRSIYSSSFLRYKTLATEEKEKGEAVAVGPITEYFLWYDQVLENRWNCDTLVLCEGPFDSLKVSVLGKAYGIDSTCFTTASPSISQIDLLGDVASKYKKRYLLLDRGTLGTAIRTSSALRALRFRVLTLPENVKDPGELDEKTLLKIIP